MGRINMEGFDYPSTNWPQEPQNQNLESVTHKIRTSRASLNECYELARLVFNC